MKITLGGDRLGSGNKMKVHLPNYGRSTHNLGKIWRSSMAAGPLVPALVLPILNGDTFEITTSASIMTLPTIGPLLGSYKLQIDFFKADMRLYNKQLHNNKLNIGRNMQNVKFPMLRIAGRKSKNGVPTNERQVNPSSLLAYLGTKGYGKTNASGGANWIIRDINAMPAMMYFDIAKNYYANKQEETAYYIGGEVELTNTEVDYMVNQTTGNRNPSIKATIGGISGDLYLLSDQNMYLIKGLNLNTNSMYEVTQAPGGEPTLVGIIGDTDNIQVEDATDNEVRLTLNLAGGTSSTNYYLLIDTTILQNGITKNKLIPFGLESIDYIREKMLEAPNGVPFILKDEGDADNPYYGIFGELFERTGTTSIEPGTTNSNMPMGGLMVKTYMSDRFNNWLATEWIDGVGGINDITAIDVSDGKLQIESLILQEKIHKMLYRVAISGGSYEDWEEAIWGDVVKGHPEIPIYLGGLSEDIIFQEVVSNSAAPDEPLGTLAGRGRMMKAGDKLHVKAERAGYLMAIASITPRVDYSQGNKWFTRLETMNDLHKPQLDGIGFQELITDEMAAFDTELAPGDGINPNEVTYKSAGKQPSWIHYQTDTNETYGTFAEEYNTMFMTLNRKYEEDLTGGGINDLTTYIDPQKYNYVFADTNLDAQNFWVQIAFDIKARRKMSANQIPNL